MTGILGKPLSWGTRLWGRVPQELRRVVVLVLLGSVTGLVAVLFHYCVEGISRRTFEHLAGQGTGFFLAGSLASITGGVLLVTAIIRLFDPSCEGGGVMPVKLAFWKKAGVMRLRTAVVKFVGSTLTLGSGVSMGPEGPVIQIGAAGMSATAGWLGVPETRRRRYAAAGAAAALAAVFNAPLAAIAFVLEEIVGDLSSRFIGGIVVAAIMGGLVTNALLGTQPAFQAAELGEVSGYGILFCPLVAALAALGGVAFQRGALAVRGRFKAQRKISGWFRPLLGALATWVLGGAAFVVTGHVGVFGVGYADITTCIQGGLSWWAALVLGMAKLGATIFAVGASCCGGIFAPNLFVGAMCGGTVAALGALVCPLTATDQSMLVMAGMCACLGAVIRTPAACSLLLFEVTHQFAVVPLLLVATVVAQAISRKLNHEGMYEEMMRQDGEDPNRELPPRDYHAWGEMPCAALVEREPVVLAAGEREEAAAVLAAHSFGRFPWREADGEIAGLVRREGVVRWVAEGIAPIPRPAVWVGATAPVFLAQKRLMETEEGMVCVGDERTRELRGVLTANDLLRHQLMLVEES